MADRVAAPPPGTRGPLFVYFFPGYRLGPTDGVGIRRVSYYRV